MEGSVGDFPEDNGLESSDSFEVGWFCAAPDFNTTCPGGFDNCVVNQSLVF